MQLTRPRGPIFGARAEVAPTSPPTALRHTVKQDSKTSQYQSYFLGCGLTDIKLGLLIILESGRK